MTEPPQETEVIRLAKLVKLMRDAQVGYFKDRSSQALNHARDLERRVDKAVAWIFEHRQPELPGLSPPAGQGGEPSAARPAPRPGRRWPRRES